MSSHITWHGKSRLQITYEIRGREQIDEHCVASSRECRKQHVNEYRKALDIPSLRGQLFYVWEWNATSNERERWR